MEANCDSETALDKECAALNGLFQQVVTELKVGVPSLEEFVSKAGKLHGAIKNTIVVLGSFLDAFQKIADAATNAKGPTRDIGTCLTRIVIRHRAMESRMKSLAGALLDCLILPIQGKLDEWKKVAASVDKEHTKELKRHRLQLRKKTETVSRLRRKLRQDNSASSSLRQMQQQQQQRRAASPAPDPSLSRLLDSSVREVSAQRRTLRDAGRRAVRRALAEERRRFCALAGALRPVVDQEMGLWAEVGQIEEIMNKLAVLTVSPHAFPDSCEQVIEDIGLLDSDPLANAPSEASSALGSRKNSMCSISSLVSAASTVNATNRPMDTLSLSGSIKMSNEDNIEDSTSLASSTLARPSSAVERSASSLRWQSSSLRPPSSMEQSTSSVSSFSAAAASEDICQMFRQHSSEPVSPAKSNGASAVLTAVAQPPASPSASSEQNFSTIRRSFSHRSSPFRRPSSEAPLAAAGGAAAAGPIPAAGSVARRPPLPQRCASAERCLGPPPLKPIPSAAVKLMKSSNAFLPDFNVGKNDMVIPQPVYMNTDDLNLRPKQQPPTEDDEDDDLKTPTVEELSFPGQKAVAVVAGSAEDTNSSSSSGSIGSSSGYGSQNTITKSTEEAQQQQIRQQQSGKGEGLRFFSSSSTVCAPPASSTNSVLHRPPRYSILGDLDRRRLDRRSVQMKRSDSFTPGCHPVVGATASGASIGAPAAAAQSPGAALLQRSNSSSNSSSSRMPPPPPPLRRTSSITSNHAISCADDPDDATPHGSVENLPPAAGGDEALEVMAAKASDMANSLSSINNNSILSLLKRSTSMTTSNHGGNSLDSRALARRSLMDNYPQLENKGARVTFSPLVRDDHHYNRVDIKHVIPVKSGAISSPEAEIYGFGRRFQENSRQYHHSHPAAAPPPVPAAAPALSQQRRHASPPQLEPQPPPMALMNHEALQNQLFLDSLSAKLTGSVIPRSSSSAFDQATDSNSSTLQSRPANGGLPSIRDFAL